MKIFDALPGPLKDIVSPILGIVVAVKFVAQHWKRPSPILTTRHGTSSAVSRPVAGLPRPDRPMGRGFLALARELLAHLRRGDHPDHPRAVRPDRIRRPDLHPRDDRHLEGLFDLLIPIFRAGWALVKGVFQAAWT